MGNCHCNLIDETTSTNCDICNNPLHHKYYLCDFCKNRYHSNCLLMYYNTADTCVYCKKKCLRQIDMGRNSRSDSFSTISIKN